MMSPIGVSEAFAPLSFGEPGGEVAFSTNTIEPGDTKECDEAGDCADREPHAAEREQRYARARSPAAGTPAPLASTAQTSVRSGDMMAAPRTSVR